MSAKPPSSYTDKDLKRLATKLNATEDPILVDVNPETWAQPNECFPNVERKIRESGGKMILGWQIWKSKDLIEAEMHAVWEDPDGDLIDITPKKPALPQIMFIEDANLHYEGKQVDNIRLNRTKNKMVDDFIAILEAIHAFDNKGARGTSFALKLTDAEAAIRKELTDLRDMADSAVHYGMTRESACPCGRRMSWADCHGAHLAKKLARLTS